MRLAGLLSIILALFLNKIFLRDDNTKNLTINSFIYAKAPNVII